MAQVRKTTGNAGHHELISTIVRMDQLSQAGFWTIAETARRALNALQEAGATAPLHQTVSAALDGIWLIADVFANDINWEAESAGAVGNGARTTSMPNQADVKATAAALISNHATSDLQEAEPWLPIVKAMTIEYPSAENLEASQKMGLKVID